MNLGTIPFFIKGTIVDGKVTIGSEIHHLF